MSNTPTMTIPVPVVAPFGSLLDRKEYVQEVWDAFVKPEQEQMIPPSIEMRMLMAILRAVYAGFDEANYAGTAPPEDQP